MEPYKKSNLRLQNHFARQSNQEQSRVLQEEGEAAVQVEQR